MFIINLLLIFFFLVFPTNNSTIISNSQIQSCSINSSNSTNLNCTQKLVISLSIQNGQLKDSDYMEVFVSQVISMDNTQQTLQNPYRISISKSAVSAVYPSIYFQDFNFRPVEQIINSDVFSCQDGALAANPTCGWVTSDSKTVPYSQGFCCDCSFSQITGIDTTTSLRGTDCSFLSLGSGSSTAHCLRYSPLWYSAFEVKNYYIDYEIDVFITYNIGSQTNLTENTSQYTTEQISLSPSNTIALSQDNSIKANLIGDFQPPTPPDDFSDYFLTIPSSPNSNTMVLEGPLNWMLIPKNYFTLDGTECNKIGVSYSAFISQGNRCQMHVGDCLHNQIYDLYYSDINLITSGDNPNYLLYQDKTKQYSFFSDDSQNKKISYELSGVFNTLITLELIADNIKFVTNISTGTLDYFKIDTFQSSTADGVIQIQVTNTGSLTANFFLSYNCSEYILPIPGKEFSLSPFQSTSFDNNIYTFNQNFQTHECCVTLKNSIGQVIDTITTIFNSTQTISNNVQNPNMTDVNPSNSNQSANNTNDSQYQSLTCQRLCPGFFDFVCFGTNKCWGYLARTIIIIMLVLGTCLSILRCIKNGCCCGCACKMLKYITGSGHENASKDKMKNKREIYSKS